MQEVMVAGSGYPSDTKRIVEDGYDACANEYASSRSRAAPPEVTALSNRLPAGSRVLDVGCGPGVPVTRVLAERHAVTGVDLSSRQVALARSNVPRALLVWGDILAQEFAVDSFDAAVCFFALFHLSRSEQTRLLEDLAAWIRPGGLLLATLADEETEGYVETGFFGVEMFWSHFSLLDYRKLLSSNGFSTVETGTLGHGYRADLRMPPENHPYVLAERTLRSGA